MGAVLNRITSLAVYWHWPGRDHFKVLQNGYFREHPTSFFFGIRY